jgi:hypothetical protein
VREFAFELALCAHLEAPDGVLARQLGAHVAGRRVLDVVQVTPGPSFDERAAITAETIPPRAIEADVGPGSAVPVQAALDGHPDHVAEVVDRAVEVGFFERDSRGGRALVRQTARYPDDWFGELVGIENKPDLGTPGDLRTQLLTDVSLALVDRVVLATASYVTGAHLNRIPDAVGVWRFDPATGERQVVREAAALSAADPGVEILDRGAARTDVRVATAAEKAAARRRLAERAYGKGWRTFDLPACANCEPPADGRPHCTWADRAVRAATDCGADCEGYDPAPAPAVDRAARRGARSAWEPDPPGVTRRQAGLDRYR